MDHLIWYHIQNFKFTGKLVTIDICQLQQILQTFFLHPMGNGR